MTEGGPPNVVVIAGPNGAGKSTAAPKILSGPFAIAEFVNADVIAKSLSADEPERHASEAGRMMLLRLKELADARKDFAFETTLATRSFAPWLRQLIAAGYRFTLIFFYLPSADLAVARVAQRVRTGGHHVPESDVRRRYERGLRNLFRLYIPLAHEWVVYNGSMPAAPEVIASGGPAGGQIADPVAWPELERRYADPS